MCFKIFFRLTPVTTDFAKPGESIVKTISGFSDIIASIVCFIRVVNFLACARTSVIPITDKSDMGKSDLSPWAIIFCPPTPTKLTPGISCIILAPKTSPETSPAIIKIFIFFLVGFIFCCSDTTFRTIFNEIYGIHGVFIVFYFLANFINSVRNSSFVTAKYSRIHRMYCM